MKLNKLFNQINGETFIQDYLAMKGVEDFDKYTTDDDYLEDYDYYFNLKEGKKLFDECIARNRQAILLCDCDCDGIMSSAITLAYLDLLEVNTHLYCHAKKLHGTDDKYLVDKIKQSDIELVIIPDASGKQDDINDLTNCGKKILCLDHHPNNLKSSENFICINNKHNTAGNRELSGAGVAWKFFWQYCCQKTYPHYTLLPLMDLVGLSVISDSCSVVPLESRFFVNQVLKEVNNSFLQYLINRLINKEDYNAIDLAFNVIPKINASVRIGDTDLQERMVCAFAGMTDEFEELYDDMIKAHRQQTKDVKDITQSYVDYAQDNSNNLVIVIGDGESPYTGLVANKLVSATNKPVFFVHEDKDNKDNWVGSARSPIGEFKSLCNNSQLFNWNAGHECAFGTSFKKDDITKIITYFNNLRLNNSVEVCDVYNEMIPSYMFDVIDKIDRNLWCTDIPEPLFAVKLKNINGLDWNSYRGNTIKLYHNGVSYMKFRCSNKIKEQLHIGMDKKYNLTLVGTLCYNDYNGKRYPQMIIEDFETTSVDAKPDFEDIW